MRKLILLTVLFPILSFAQIDNKIEGLVINTPCELEYTRNVGNQNNYSCVNQSNSGKVFQYSVTVQNLFNDMNGLSGQTLQSYQNQFLQTVKETAEKNGERTESVTLANGQKALKTKSSLDYSGQKFAITSIVFLYKQKSFIVNLTTNDFSSSAIEKLIDRIKVQ